MTDAFDRVATMRQWCRTCQAATPGYICPRCQYAWCSRCEPQCPMCEVDDDY